MAKIPPRAPARLEIAAVVTGIACFAASIRTGAGAGCFALSILLLMRASQLPLGEVLRRLRPFVVFGGIAVAFGGLGTGEPAWRFGPLTWSREASLSSAIAAVRLIGLGAAAVWINLAVGTGRLTAHLFAASGLLRRFGLDVQPLIAGVAVALRFLPLMQGEAARLRLAWNARGAALLGRGPVSRGVYATGLAVPLLAAALRRAEHLAEAIETRGGQGISMGMGAALPGRSEPAPELARQAALTVGAVWLPWIACMGMGWL